ncbi:MAG: chemotaxis protein CheD [Rhodospirillaceae bacterium]
MLITESGDNPSSEVVGDDARTSEPAVAGMQMHRHAKPRSGQTVNLMPGELVCERTPHLLGTILGSCVAVCLWDKRLGFGGMNHYILPLRPSNELYSFRYGDVAIQALVNNMLELGSHSRDIQAKVFGGANVLRTGCGEYSVGRRNAEIAVAELHRRRIPIVASRLSGTQGVVILQCTGCGDVWVRPIVSRISAPRGPREVEELPWISGTLDTFFSVDEFGAPRTVSTRSLSPGSATSCTTCGSKKPAARVKA